MHEIRFNDRDDGHAIAACAGTAFNPSRDVSICRVRDGHRLGGVMFSNFTGESIAIHSGSWDEHWLSRDMLFVIWDYPFNQLLVKRIFGYVPQDNFHAISFNRKFGFTDVVVIDGMFENNTPCLIMKLERSDCRFLGIKPRHLQSNLH